MEPPDALWVSLVLTTGPLNSRAGAGRLARPRSVLARSGRALWSVVAAAEVAEDSQDRQEQVEDAQVDADGQHDRVVDALLRVPQALHVVHHEAREQDRGDHR